MVPEAKEAFLCQWSYKKKNHIRFQFNLCHLPFPKAILWPQDSPQTDQWLAREAATPNLRKCITYRAENSSNQGRKGLWRKEQPKFPPHDFTSPCLNLIFLSSVCNYNDHLWSLSNALHALSHLIPKTTLWNKICYHYSQRRRLSLGEIR